MAAAVMSMPHPHDTISSKKRTASALIAQAPPGQWMCGKCRFDNAPAYLFCGFCGLSKDRCDAVEAANTDQARVEAKTTLTSSPSPQPFKKNKKKKTSHSKASDHDSAKATFLPKPKLEAVVPMDDSEMLDVKTAVAVASQAKNKIKTMPDATKARANNTKATKLLPCSHFLNESASLMSGISKGIAADASVVDYDTVKDKFNPKQLHYGFAPKAHSQWHWFFVAKKKIEPMTDDDGNNKKGSYKFTIALDKFRLAQGKAQVLNDGEDGGDKEKKNSNDSDSNNNKEKKKHVFSYGCTGAKTKKTAMRKKAEFVQLALNDTEFERMDREDRARAHKASLKNMKGSTKVFIDKQGKEHPYFGMPIGAEHHWKYQDAPFLEQSLTGTAAQFQAKNVQWRELKVGKNRWALAVEGELVPDASNAKGVKLTESESILIADQIATKITPNSYHVKLKGVQLPAAGATQAQRAASAREMLAKLADKMAGFA
uniref:RanBP2-type domain-containing protein n=1 Tax=Lotharella globosa TaxID=91324 RepID=A0A7S4DN49_9EUKA